MTDKRVRKATAQYLQCILYSVHADVIAGFPGSRAGYIGDKQGHLGGLLAIHHNDALPG